MTDRIHLIVGRTSDPLVGPLYQLLAEAGNQVRLGVSSADGADDTTDVWFADHLSFLLSGGRASEPTTRQHIILRADTVAGDPSINVDLALALAKSLPQLVTQFWAVQPDQAASLAATYGIDVQSLVPAAPTRPALPALELNFRQNTASRPDSPAQTFSLQRANLARLARRFRLVCAQADDLNGQEIVALANAAQPTGVKTDNRVLFILPHGAGLGHISRCLAIAQQLDGFRCDFLVYNAAAFLVAAAGFNVVHRQSAITLDADPEDWRAWEKAELLHYITTQRPAAVLVDASSIDPFIAETLAHPAAMNTALFWIRREMWRKDRVRIAAPATLQNDAIIVPQELAQSDEAPSADSIATVENGLAELATVPPITMQAAPLGRLRARKALGLGRGRICLVSLGAWEDPQHKRQIATLIASAQKNRVQLVWARSPLAGANPHDATDHKQIAAYPLLQYLSAFDGVVSTAGYNSFHELMHHYHGPVMFLPVDQRGLDDQVGRAQFAARTGIADIVDTQNLSQSAGAFFAKVRRRQTVDRKGGQSNGAIAAAQAIRQWIVAYQGGSNG